MLFVDKNIVDNSEASLALIKTNMVSFPEKIYELKVELININQEIMDKKDELKGLESELLLDLSNDSNLKNQAQRDAKIFIECKNSQEYQSIKRELNDLQTEKQKKHDMIEYYEQQFSVMKKLHNEHMTILQKDIFNKGDSNGQQQDEDTT